MNSDADYSYSEPPPLYSSSGSSIQLPFALLSCAIAMFMIMQTLAVFRQKSALQEGKTQLVDAFAKREPLVKTSGELKSKLQALVNDLLILGKTDDDAKAIIAKYNIRQDLPGSASEAEAPK
jgi:hypothetical protein